MSDTRFEFGSSDIDRRYDQGRTLTAAASAALADALRRHAPPRVGRVLDLGGGTGRFSALLGQTFAAPVVLLEPAANMMAAARAKLQGLSIGFVGGSAAGIPFADGAFELVFVSQVMHHIVDRRAAMSEVRRVLGAGGCLFVRQCTMENLDGYFYQRFFPEARAIDGRRIPSRAQLVSEARSAGLVLAAPPEAVGVEMGQTWRDYVAKVATRTYSDLVMIPDEAFARGLEQLTRYFEANPVPPQTECVDQFAFIAS